MNESLTVLSTVVPVFAIVGAGFALRKLNWLTEEAALGFGMKFVGL